jgi:hypothetical protein
MNLKKVETWNLKALPGRKEGRKEGMKMEKQRKKFRICLIAIAKSELPKANNKSHHSVTMTNRSQYLNWTGVEMKYGMGVVLAKTSCNP